MGLFRSQPSPTNSAEEAENEGQILFCVDRTKTQGQQWWLETSITKVLDTLEQAQVVSALLLVLEGIARQWQTTHANVDVAELCTYLAENKFGVFRCWVQTLGFSGFLAVLAALWWHRLTPRGRKLTLCSQVSSAVSGQGVISYHRGKPAPTTPKCQPPSHSKWPK